MNDRVRGRDIAKAALSTGLSLVPGGALFTPLTNHLIDKSAAELTATYSRAIGVTARNAGLSVEDLHDLIADSPDLIPLHTRLVVLAARSRRTRVLDAAAAAVGDAAAGRTPPDEAELMLTSLEALNDSHLDLLARVAAHVEPDRIEIEGAIPPEVQDAWLEWAKAANYEAWVSTPAEDLLVSQLIASGLLRVRTGGYGGYEPVDVTAWGHSLLDALTELSQGQDTSMGRTQPVAR